MQDFNGLFGMDFDLDAEVEGIDEIIERLKSKTIPESYPNTISTSIKSFRYREEIIQYSGYSLLAKDWLEPFAAWIGKRKCLEIMAGSGALTKALLDLGVDIRATDDYSWTNHNWFEDT